MPVVPNAHTSEGRREVHNRTAPSLKSRKSSSFPASDYPGRHTGKIDDLWV